MRPKQAHLLMLLVPIQLPRRVLQALPSQQARTMADQRYSHITQDSLLSIHQAAQRLMLSPGARHLATRQLSIVVAPSHLHGALYLPLRLVSVMALNVTQLLHATIGCLKCRSLMQMETLIRLRGGHRMGMQLRRELIKVRAQSLAVVASTQLRLELRLSEL